MIVGFDSKLPAGRVQGSASDLALEVSGSLETMTRLSKTPIRKDANGAIVELGDICTIQRGTPDPPPAKASSADFLASSSELKYGMNRALIGGTRTRRKY